MICIYLITNNKNGKVYVGQTNDFKRRAAEHLRSGQLEKYSKKNERDSNTPIHLAMQKYGVENFTFTILEECSQEELNEKEKFWISYYNSTDKTKGYNLTKGGQLNFALKGEKHGQAKLTQEDVNEIKRLLKETDLTLNEIKERFPFISKSSLSMINQGKTWKDSEEKYPLRKKFNSQIGEKASHSLFSDEEVIKIRTLYSKGKTPKEIFEIYNKYSPNTIQAILYGNSYKHLPRWNNKLKKWI